MAIKHKTTKTEEQILRHMDMILKIMNQAEPQHGIISIAIDNGYYSLMCGGDGPTSFRRLMNFSFHSGKDSYVTRYNTRSELNTTDIDIPDMDKYLTEQERLRAHEAIFRKDDAND